MKTLTSTMQASMRRAGLIAGLGLLLMSILAGLATFGVLDRLVTEGDASRTTSQILAALVRSGLRSSPCSSSPSST